MIPLVLVSLACCVVKTPLIPVYTQFAELLRSREELGCCVTSFLIFNAKCYKSIFVLPNSYRGPTFQVNYDKLPQSDHS